MLIDTHAHVIPRDYPPDSPACFPAMEPVPGDTARTLVSGLMRFTAKEVFFTGERRVEAMDASGVDVEVVSPMPPLLDYALPSAEGLELCRWVNESVAGICAVAPSRILGFGMVPMQDVELAAKELTALKEAGLLGVEIGSNVNGVSIGDPALLPFFQEAERLALPVFVHASRPALGERLPAAAFGTFGFATEASIAAASMITGGTAQRCPDLRLAFSHGAGGFPLMLTRAQYFWSGTWNEEPGDPDRALGDADPVSPMEYARRFYYDALVFDRRALRYLIDMLGPSQLLVGSDFPAMPREDPGDRTLRSMDLEPDVLAGITWNNAFGFLGLDPARYGPAA